MADISAMKHHQMQVLATRADVKHLRGSSMFPRLSGKVLVSGAWHSRKKTNFKAILLQASLILFSPTLMLQIRRQTTLSTTDNLMLITS